MLVIQVMREPEGDITGLVARGHTGFDERGKDIVCAGASAVVHTAVLGVTRTAALPAQVRAAEGYLELHLDPAQRREAAGWQKAQAVLAAAALGLEEIARRYPEHVRFQQQTAGAAAGGGKG